MKRCPFCGSHNVIPLPMGDFLCLDCDEQFYEGETDQTTCQKVSGKALSFLIKKGPKILSDASKVAVHELPKILKGATLFF